MQFTVVPYEPTEPYTTGYKSQESNHIDTANYESPIISFEEMEENENEDNIFMAGIKHKLVLSELNEMQLAQYNAFIRKVNKTSRRGANILLTFPQIEIDDCTQNAKLMIKHINNYFVYGKNVKPNLIVVGWENHHESDGIHAHAFVQLEKKVQISDTSDLMFANKHYNLEFISSAIKGFFYVTKETDHIYYQGEIGEFMKHRDNLIEKIMKPSKKASQNQYIVQELEKGNLTQLVKEGWIDIRDVQRVNTGFNIYKAFDKENEYQINWGSHRGMWIYGPSGIGKTTLAKKISDIIYDEKNPYMKGQNKWFDGYAGQPVVILDDLDLKEASFMHYLKIWGDWQSFNAQAEIKGGSICSMWKVIIVTSNYRIEEFCNGDMELKAAIERRFRVFKAGRQMPTHDCTVIQENGLEYYLNRQSGELAPYEEHPFRVPEQATPILNLEQMQRMWENANPNINE